MSNNGVQEPARIIQETVDQWVEEDNQLSHSRRAVQRRRLQRQVRLAMDNDRVGDAVRAEAILARLDDQEADAEAGKTENDFDVLMKGKTDEEINFYVTHERFPNEGELDQKPEEEAADESVH